MSSGVRQLRPFRDQRSCPRAWYGFEEADAAPLLRSGISPTAPPRLRQPTYRTPWPPIQRFPLMVQRRSTRRVLPPRSTIPMRTIVPMLLAFMTLFPACTMSQALAPSGLVGRWAGSGTFFNRDLHAKVGPLPFKGQVGPGHHQARCNDDPGRVSPEVELHLRPAHARGPGDADARSVDCHRRSLPNAHRRT